MKDRRLRQGSWAWPAHNGVAAARFAHWWTARLLNIEGEDHHRLRRLSTRPSRATDRPPGPAFPVAGQRTDRRFYAGGPLRLRHPVRRALRRTGHRHLLGIDEAAGTTSRLVERHRPGAGGHLQARTWSGSRPPWPSTPSRRAHRATAAPTPGDVSRASCSPRRAGRAPLPTTSCGRWSAVDLRRHGHDQNQLGLAMQTFIAHPDQWALLARSTRAGQTPSRRSSA